MAGAIAALGGVAGRTRVWRGASPGSDVPWELWRQVPCTELHGLVLELWAGLEPSGLARHRVLPNGEVTLMLHLGSGQRLIEHAGVPASLQLRGGFISGLQEAPSTFESLPAAMRVVTARLTPLGAWLLLDGLPQAELAQRVIDIDAVLGLRSGIVDLRDRMCEAEDLGVALDQLETWLLQQYGRSRCAPHAATQLGGQLLRGGGRSVESLARECGVSARRLHELFVREVGLAPKRLSRILRFRRALEQLARAPRADLRELALDCGYYDQSHMYRDFQALAGMTPLEYLSLRDGMHEDADVVAG